MIEPHLREGGAASNALSTLQRCKSLARVIKFQRAPSWPSPPSADLPPKDVADELVDCYLRTSERIYRILHIPSFRRDYESLWVSDSQPNAPFLVQLKLVLAIGATVYDERFSLRTSAIRWVYEGQSWISEPIFKPRLGIQSLQTNLLLLIAQEAVDVGGESIWISAGALLRRAVYMGLHRDPVRLPQRTTFAAEMRRRLWNTILEIAVHSSLTSGGPPLVSLDDFDTEPPSNLDDDQLVVEDPMPKPENNFTQVSIAIALRKTLPLRLSVVKALNNLSSQLKYDETLSLDAELRASYKTLCRVLQSCNSSAGPSPSQFEIRVVDYIMHRYISSLHAPWFSLAMHETAYAFSRRVVVESSLKIWRAAFPSPSTVATRPQPRGDTAPSDRDDFARLATCGSGFYRTVATQASLLIAVELRTQLQEEESLGPVPLREDLLAVLYDAKIWCLQCIEAGETNVKGYLFISIVVAHIEGLRRGLGKGEMPELLIKAAEGAQQRCLPILEDMVAQTRVQGTDGEVQGMSLDTPAGISEDWDFMVRKSRRH